MWIYQGSMMMEEWKEPLRSGFFSIKFMVLRSKVEYNEAI